MYRLPTAHRTVAPILLVIAALVALIAPNAPGRAAEAGDADYSAYDHNKGKYTVCKHGCRYDRIQKAVDEAKSGAIILIGPGTYFENVVIDKNSVTLVGVSANETTVDGRFRGPVFVLGSQAVGTAAAQISVTLTGMTITHGEGVTGGGIVQNALTFLMTDSVIVSNVATQSGGGIEVKAVGGYPTLGTTIERCDIVHNQAPVGAGIEVEWEAGAQITDSLIADNTGGDGAGLHGEYASYTTIVGTTVSNNTSSGSGGGIWIAQPHERFVPSGIVTLESSAVVNNTAAQLCGGVAIFSDFGTTCEVGSPGVVIALNVPGP